MDKETIVLKTIDEIKIYSDPYRLSILHAFNRLGRPATVKEVADSMGEAPGKVYYHVKKLEQVGIVWVEETRSINGIIAKYYALFKGEISILQKEFEPALHEVYLSETRKLVGGIFNTTRDKYLSRLSKDKHLKGNFINRTLFMTEENAVDLFAHIEQMLNDYTQPADFPGTMPYDFFGAIMIDGVTPDKVVDGQTVDSLEVNNQTTDPKNTDESRSEL
ncbi:MAG: helix-turn-helix domain-containing protein [Gorillibacterium sp.]|nr:helix-turn-helix domain-containing protein [Gorillibacterium sp.]